MILLIEYQYFGNINLYKILYKNKHIIFEVYENYQKSSFRNKMELASPYGPHILSVPILGGRGIRELTRNVKIENNQNWQEQHFKTICNLYNKPPWFEFYKSDLEKLYNTPFELLIDWDKTCMSWVLGKLKINAIVADTQEFIKNYSNDEYLDLRSYSLDKSKILEQLSTPQYPQVFEDKIGFLPNLSILDLLFCEGPNAVSFLL